MCIRALQPGFDPFQQNGWIPFATGGIEAVKRKEAPLLMYAFDVDEPEYADALAARYEDEGLRPSDLRVGVWPDAFPQPARTDQEVSELGGPAVHLNVFGGRQILYDQATPPERAALNALRLVTAKHVREILNPNYGVTVQEFNEQVPTTHLHVIARELPNDGLDLTRERTKIGLDHRRAVAERVSFDLVPGRREKIEEYLRATLTGCLTNPARINDPF